MRWFLLFLLLPLGVTAQVNLCSNTYTGHATVNSTGSGKITFIGDSINSGNSSTPCIHLTNYDTVIIKHCKLINSSAQAILLTNVKYSIIDSNYMANVSDGVHDNVSPYDHVPGRIFFRHNYIKNILGPFPLGNAIQLNQVHAGSIIAYNYIECIDSSGRHPQDILSIYKSNGLTGDSIMVINNFIKGGQVNNDSGGAAGIVLNDVGGSLQVARGNRLVNPGAVGIQVQGGFGSKVDHNYIYGDGHGALSFEGLQYGNYASDTTYNITMSSNTVYWRQTAAHSFAVFNRWVDKALANVNSTASGFSGGPTLPDPIGWITNTGITTAGATTPSIVPTPMIVSCTVPPIPPTPPPTGTTITVAGVGRVILE